LDFIPSRLWLSRRDLRFDIFHCFVYRSVPQLISSPSSRGAGDGGGESAERMKRRSTRWMAPFLRGAVSVLARPTVTACSTLPRLSAVGAGYSPGRTAQRVSSATVVTALVTGAGDRPIFFLGSSYGF
jgi:hypothetical protein